MKMGGDAFPHNGTENNNTGGWGTTKTKRGKGGWKMVQMRHSENRSAHLSTNKAKKGRAPMAATTFGYFQLRGGKKRRGGKRAAQKGRSGGAGESGDVIERTDGGARFHAIGPKNPETGDKKITRSSNS